jgi:hypothetical protein
MEILTSADENPIPSSHPAESKLSTTVLTSLLFMAAGLTLCCLCIRWSRARCEDTIYDDITLPKTKKAN